MDRRRPSFRQRTPASAVSRGKPLLDFSDEEEESEGEGVLSTSGRGRGPPSLRGSGGGERRGGGRSRPHHEEKTNHRNEEEEGSEEDDSEDDHENGHGNRSLGGGMPMPGYGGGPSYLPTAYGAAPVQGGPESNLGPQPRRDRSVDRIRERTRDRRRDISKDRSAVVGRRDRSRSVSQSREVPNPASQRAAERRRNRRASLESSLGMSVGGGMDDSVSSFDLQSVHTATSDVSALAMGINGMDSSISSRIHRGGNRKAVRRASSRDSTSTDYTAERRRQAALKPSKTWDGRVDEVLKSRRRRPPN